MTLDEYQKLAEEFAVYPNRKIPGLFYAILALGGECGELQNKLKKFIRSNKEPDSRILADELGDVLWYVAAVARELGLKLSEVAGENLLKLQARKEADPSFTFQGKNV